jgi:hypothetical protein
MQNTQNNENKHDTRQPNKKMENVLNQLRLFKCKRKFLKLYPFTEGQWLGVQLSIYLSIYLSTYLWLYDPFVGPWSIFSFSILNKVGRSPWTGISPSQGRNTDTE